MSKRKRGDQAKNSAADITSSVKITSDLDQLHRLMMATVASPHGKQKLHLTTEGGTVW